MGRRVVLIFVFLLLGAIVNVAVAWGLAATVYERPSDRYHDVRAHYSDDYWFWIAYTRHTPSASLVSGQWLSRHARAIRPIPSMYEAATQTPPHVHPFELLTPIEMNYLASRWDQSQWGGHEFASYGLPLRSLWRGRIGREPIMTAELSIGERELMLPLRPLMAGFIINTLIYTLLLWLLFLAPLAARRILRRRRGLCENCAYPIGTWGGSPVCTECGAALPRKVEA